MIAFNRAGPCALALVSLSMTVACGDSPAGPHDSEPAPLVISDASAGVAAQRAIGLSAGVYSMGPLAYVSLPPGSIPGGESATVTNLANGESFSRVIVDGGFDPVEIGAGVGDTLELVAVQPTGLLTARAVVPAVRRPRVIRTSPAKGRTDVALNASIVVVFSEPIDSAALEASVRLLHQGSPLEGSLRIGLGQLSVEFAPASPLAPGGTYQIVVEDDITDRTGQQLEGMTTFEFTTSSVVASPPPSGPGWQLKATSGTSRYSTAGAVIDGIIYVVGGRDDCCPWWDSDESPLGTLEAFDPSTGKWSTRARMPTPRYDLAVGVVDGILYAVGGNIGTGMVSTVEAYDPVADTWTVRAPMPTPRLGHGVGVVGGVLYAVGGLHNSGIVEAYDPVANTWSRKQDMPTPRIYIGVGSLDGRLYAINGVHSTPLTGDGFTAAVEAYDPVTDTWSARAPTPSPWHRATATLGANLYSLGFDDSGMARYDAASDTWEPAASLPQAAGGLRPEAIAVIDGTLYAVVMQYGTDGFSTYVYALTP